MKVRNLILNLVVMGVGVLGFSNGALAGAAVVPLSAEIISTAKYVFNGGALFTDGISSALVRSKSGTVFLAAHTSDPRTCTMYLDSPVDPNKNPYGGIYTGVPKVVLTGADSMPIGQTARLTAKIVVTWLLPGGATSSMAVDFDGKSGAGLALVTRVGEKEWIATDGGSIGRVGTRVYGLYNVPFHAHFIP